MAHQTSVGRAKAAGVCKAFRAATLNPKLWTKLNVTLTKEENCGQLLSWFFPRRQDLTRLTIVGEFTPGPAAWTYMTALASTSSLVDLIIGVQGVLEVGPWALPLMNLRSASFTCATLKVGRLALLGGSFEFP